MGLIDVKEKVTKTLGGFLDRNKEYIVEAYISNTGCMLRLIGHLKQMIKDLRWNGIISRI